MEDQKKDFFISYTAKDRQWAEWIAWQLESAGFTVFIQAWDFVAGSDFIEEMDRASQKSRRTIAVISPDYFKSKFTKAEWHALLAEDPTGEDRKLIPVRVRECEVEGLLRARVYIDLVGKDKSEAKDELMRQIRAVVESRRLKPDDEPEFPLPYQRAPIGAQTEEPPFPGALPAVWNIPLRRNPHFTGRDRLIAEIKEALAAGEVVALTQPQAITELGGVGKTQLAVEYAYRQAREYDIVWWVRSEELVTMAVDFVSLGPELNPPIELAADLDGNVAAVKLRLEQTSHWLLIFDNAPDAGSAREILPRSSTGHILITSRDQNWRGIARALPVPTLKHQDAVKFLLERTGQSDRSAAYSLAYYLEDLPLALEQAGAYIETTGKPIADYLRLFHGKLVEMFGMIERGHFHVTHYEMVIIITWDISFQSLRNESPAAADLLNLFAFFSPDPIRREWIVAGPKHLPKTLAAAVELIQSIFSRIRGAKHLPKTLAAALTDELTFDNIAAAFRRYSLVDVVAEQKTFTVHRDVQAVTRFRMKYNERAKWAKAAARLVNDAFPGGNFHEQPETWPLCGELLLHALSVTEHAEAFTVASRQTIKLLNRLEVYLRVLARYEEAKEPLERYFAIYGPFFGPHPLRMVASVNNLAVVLHDLGDLAQARKLLERAYRILRKSFPHYDLYNTAVHKNLITLIKKMSGEG